MTIQFRITYFICLKPVLQFLLFVLFYSGSLYSQSYIADIRKLSVEDGLSNRFVNTICKDSNGYIWIGTKYGLNRYDGYSFKLYTSENSGLASNSVKDIHEDKNHKLWLIYGNPYNPHRIENIDILDSKTNKVQSFEEVFNNIDLFKVSDIRYIYTDVNKTIWISTEKGNVYRYYENSFELIFLANTKETLQIFYADNTSIWLSGKELIKVNLKGTVLKRFYFQERPRNIGVDNEKNLWIYLVNKKEVLKITEEGQQPITVEQFKFYKNNHGSISFKMNYLNPINNLIWWCPQGISDEFFVYHPQKGIVYDLQKKISPLLTYGRPHITDMYFDSEDRTWITTYDGIFVITLRKSKFTILPSEKPEDYSTRGIIEDDKGDIYINSYSGRIKLNPEKGAIEEIREKGIYNWMGATKDKEGNLWFSEEKLMVEKYNPSNEKSQYYHSVDTLNIPGPWSQWAMIRDKNGRVWTGTDWGLYYIEPETGKYQRFRKYNNFSLLRKSSVYYMDEDESGIWIASSSGLYHLEHEKGITTRYAMEENIPYHIPYNHLLHFHRDTSGIFWLATKDGGLIRFDPKTGFHKQFTTAEGLSSNIIYAVYEDANRKLWLPSNYGLMQFDMDNYRVNTYLTGDGIAHQEFNTASHYQDAKGRLYFGGLSGVTFFDPKDLIVANTTPVPLRMTRCRILSSKTGKLVDKTVEVSNFGKLVLSPSDKSFIIQFALLNYMNTQQNSYTYKIEGLDKDWTAIEENSLRINALPYGKYILRIKGQGIKGEWSANELTISIIVTIPFYKKTEFIFACIFSLLLLLFYFFYLYLQRLYKSKIRLKEAIKQRTQEIHRQKDEIERQAEKLKELNTFQSRWFTNIAHELRTPLTLILGPIREFLKTQSGKLDTDIKSIELAEKNSVGLLKLVNEILDISKLESNQLELRKTQVNLTSLITELTAHFNTYAVQKGIILKTSIPMDVNLNIDKERIRKILMNLISNALKFTSPGGKVEIFVSLENKNTIEISVKDTGNGIPEKDVLHIFERYFQASDSERVDQGGTGIGLALSMELAKLHEGDLKVISKLNVGSTFTLSLPKTLVANMKRSGPIQPIKAHAVSPDILTKYTIGRQSKKPLVLLVEDNPDMREYILSFMSDAYEVIEAVDGLEAMKYLKEMTPDLIISDIMMPRMDGITLAKKLRSDTCFKNIPFIMLTARDDEFDKITVLRIGIDDYLTKPFNTEELETRVSNLIRNNKERKAASEVDSNEVIMPTFLDLQILNMKEVIIKQLENNSLTVNDLADSQNISLSTLKRSLKKTTGLSPGQFIREIKLQEARKFLETKQYFTVLEVVHAVGFENASHFTKLFSERFGKKPSEYL